MSNIRRLVPDDAAPYRALMLDAYARHPDAFTSTVAERATLPLAWWQARLSDEPLAPSVVFGAWAGDALAGVAGLSFESGDKTRHKAWLFGMVVTQAHRQQGLGRRLVMAALDHARARGGVRVVQLTVTEGNDAARLLYEGCGFQTFGIEPMAVALETGFAAKRHMWCALDEPPSTPRPA